MGRSGQSGFFFFLRVLCGLCVKRFFLTPSTQRTQRGKEGGYPHVYVYGNENMLNIKGVPVAGHTIGQLHMTAKIDGIGGLAGDVCGT